MTATRSILLVVALTALVAGCVAPPGGNGGPEFQTVVFDEPGSPSPVIAGGLTYPQGSDGGGERFYATVVASDSDTARFDRTLLSPNATRLVDETDFESSYLLVIQAFPASSVPDYRIESVRREGSTLRVQINDSSDFGTDDVTLETVLVRIAGSPPERVAITTEDGFEFEADSGVATRTPRDG